jgi:hypothetical protein
MLPVKGLVTEAKGNAAVGAWLGKAGATGAPVGGGKGSAAAVAWFNGAGAAGATVGGSTMAPVKGLVQLGLVQLGLVLLGLLTVDKGNAWLGKADATGPPIGGAKESAAAGACINRAGAAGAPVDCATMMPVKGLATVGKGIAAAGARLGRVRAGGVLVSGDTMLAIGEPCTMGCTVPPGGIGQAEGSGVDVNGDVGESSRRVLIGGVSANL